MKQEFIINKGALPKISANLLPEGYAQLADNAKLWSGELRPFFGPSLTKLLSPGGDDVQSIFLYENQYWLNWLMDVDVHPGPLEKDTYKRLFWTEEGGAYPKKASFDEITVNGLDGNLPGSSRKLGIRYATSIPTVAKQSGASGGNLEARVYIFTYISDWGEESAPSEPTIITDLYDDDTNRFTFNDATDLTALAAGGYGYDVDTWKRRVYRSVTGELDTWYLFVGDTTDCNETYLDDAIAPKDLGSSCPSYYLRDGTVIYWDEPPNDLHGLTPLPNGAFAGFSGKSVYFSEPHKPWAWPDAYSRDLDYEIIALAADGISLYIGTEGYPYHFFGDHPFYMTKERSSNRQSCSSKRSMASLDTGVIFASPDGLVQMQGKQAIVITKAAISRREWQVFTPSSMKGEVHDGRYYLFYESTAGVTRGFIFEPAQPYPIIVTLDTYATALYSDLLTDALYYVQDGIVYEWEGDTATLLTFDWRSGVRETAQLINFSAGRVIASYDGGPTAEEIASFNSSLEVYTLANATLLLTPSLEPGVVDGDEMNSLALGGSGYIPVPATTDGQFLLILYGDGLERFRKVIPNKEPFRLPAGYTAREWEVRVIGSLPIRRVILATSRKECG